MGRRVSAKQLAEIWIVTPERVNQIARSGRITKGSDGLFDLDEAMTFRQQQISDDEVQTLLKSYGSRHGTVTPPKAVDHVVAASKSEPMVSVRRAHAYVELMLGQIGVEAFADLPLNIATRIGAGTPDESHIAIVVEERLSGLRKMQEIAMTYGFLKPDHD